MLPRRLLFALVTLGCLLPIVVVVVGGTAWLLAAMQDTSAASLLDRLALAAGILWMLDLAALILALGIQALGPGDSESTSSESSDREDPPQPPR